jgi:hypothetical protein
LAAEQFRVDVSRADGKPVQSRDYDLMGVSGVVPDGPAMSQFAAQARCRRAWVCVRGEENNAWCADVIRLVLLALASLQTVDQRFGWRDHSRRSRALLDLGLTRLVDFYFGTNHSRQRAA